MVGRLPPAGRQHAAGAGPVRLVLQIHQWRRDVDHLEHPLRILAEPRHLGGWQPVAGRFAGYLYQSIDAGTTWNKLAMATNTTAVCSDTFLVSGYSFYTNYNGTGIIVTNSGMLTTNYPVITHYFSNSVPIVTGSVSFQPGSLLTMTNDSVVGVNWFGLTQTGTTNIYTTNTLGGVKTITTNTYPIFSTNVFAAMFDATLQGSNVTETLAGTTTNILGVGTLGTNVVSANIINIGTDAIVVGTNAISTNAIVVGANAITIGTNAIVISTNAISIGAKVISSCTNVISTKTIYSKVAVVMPDSVITQEVVASLAIPDVAGMSNTNGVTLGTNYFADVLSTNVFIGTNSGINLLVSNVFYVTVVITNAIQSGLPRLPQPMAVTLQRPSMAD